MKFAFIISKISKKNDEIRWTLSHHKFKEYVANNTNYSPSIPIVMSYDQTQNYIEYLVIIKTESRKCDIGVSVAFNTKSQSIWITGIHIDKQSILEQHHLAMGYPHNQTCKCLDSWNDNATITHLSVGDPYLMMIDKQRLTSKVAKQEAVINTMVNISNMSATLMLPAISPCSLINPSSILLTSAFNQPYLPTSSPMNNVYLSQQEPQIVNYNVKSSVNNCYHIQPQNFKRNNGNYF